MQIRLLLDEHISPKVAAALRGQGIDACAITELDYVNIQGSPDEQVLERATEEKRVVITYNYADFVLLHKEWVLKDKGHAGIGLVPRGLIPSSDQRKQVRAFKGFSKEHSSLESQLIWLR